MLFPEDENIGHNSNEEFKRLTTPYTYKSEKFHLKTKDYAKQFAHIYACRLLEMTKLLEAKAREKWASKYPIKKLCDLREEQPEKCIIIGTLYKHQELKPSVLREISEENQLAPQPPRLNFTDDNDKLILEDELQRIRLLGKFDVHNMVTGISCAVLGYVECDGKFDVEEFLFYGSGPQKPLKSLDDSPLLVITSGLGLSSSDDITMSLELLQQWIFGNFDGFDNNCDWEAASVVRVIIGGNTVRSSPEVKQKSLLTRRPESSNTLDAVKYCDRICSQWSKSVNVDLMPGEFDPSNFMLPQQPLHHCMFPQSSKLKSFQSVTNPYLCEIADRLILGTSGQNIQNIMRVSKIETPIEALRSSLIWSHIAPTSPDTLPCYPYTDKDPFIIEDCPHIYFAGNQPHFETELFKGNDGQVTRLISVPIFHKTRSVVVVNLRTLDCRNLSFDMNDFEE